MEELDVGLTPDAAPLPDPAGDAALAVEVVPLLRPYRSLGVAPVLPVAIAFEVVVFERLDVDGVNAYRSFVDIAFVPDRSELPDAAVAAALAGYRFVLALMPNDGGVVDKVEVEAVELAPAFALLSSAIMLLVALGGVESGSASLPAAAVSAF